MGGPCQLSPGWIMASASSGRCDASTMESRHSASLTACGGRWWRPRASVESLAGADAGSHKTVLQFQTARKAALASYHAKGSHPASGTLTAAVPRSSAQAAPLRPPPTCCTLAIILSSSRLRRWSMMPGVSRNTACAWRAGCGGLPVLLGLADGT